MSKPSTTTKKQWACISHTCPLAVVERCSEKGCKVTVISKEKIIFNGENTVKLDDNKRPDCIIFIKINRVVYLAVVELKSGYFNADDIQKKLQVGIETAMDIAQKCQLDILPQQIFPILAYHNITKYENRLLRSKNSRIMVKGATLDIVKVRCGSILETILKKYF